MDVFIGVESSKGLIVYNKDNGPSFFTNMCNTNMLTITKDGPCTWINKSGFLKLLKKIKNTKRKNVCFHHKLLGSLGVKFLT